MVFTVEHQKYIDDVFARLQGWSLVADAYDSVLIRHEVLFDPQVPNLTLEQIIQNDYGYGVSYNNYTLSVDGFANTPDATTGILIVQMRITSGSNFTVFNVTYNITSQAIENDAIVTCVATGANIDSQRFISGIFPAAHFDEPVEGYTLHYLQSRILA